MEESEELKKIDELISKIYPKKKTELITKDEKIKNLLNKSFLSEELNKSTKHLYDQLVDIQLKYITNEINNKELKNQINKLQNIAEPLVVNDTSDEMNRMYTLVEKVHHKMKIINNNLNDPANIKMKNTINNILKKGVEEIYKNEYEKLDKLAKINKTSILTGQSVSPISQNIVINYIFFDTVYMATIKMLESDLNKFKSLYIDFFYNDNVETKMRDLFEDALGSVQIFVKLKVSENINNELITIDNNNIFLTYGDNKKQRISINCYNGVIPEKYNNLNTKDIIDNASNKTLYKSLSSKIDLALKNYNIICFGSGYSGAGKTFTLLKGDNSIIKEIYNKYKTKYTLKLSVFEQYGYWDIHNNTKLSKIFSIEDNHFTEHIYIYNLKNIKDEKINMETLKIYLNKENYSVVIDNIDYVLDEIEKIRKNNRRVKFTINNPESSRSHIYYLIKIIDSNLKEKGYITIIDMGGQENPREIFLDYMGGSNILFENYFNIFYKNKITLKKFNPFSDQYNNDNLTVGGMFEYYNKIVKNSILDNKLKIINELIDNTNIYNKLFPSIAHKWFFLSFYYPIELFLLIKIYIEKKTIISINSAYKNNTLKEIFTKLGTSYSDIFCLLEQLKETMNIFVKRIKNEYNNLLDIIDFFIEETIKKSPGLDIRTQFNTLKKQDTLYNLFIIRLLFESFLEGFYINETLINKMNFLKSEQMITIVEQRYIGIDSPNYNPFIGMGIMTMTKNIFEYLSELSGLTKLNGQHLKKFIEIACIRADISTISEIENKAIDKQEIEKNILKKNSCGDYDIDFKKTDKNYKYKYAIASCITLKSSAMISGAQCNTAEWCSLSSQETKQEGGLNDLFYYNKYLKYKTKYLSSLAKLKYS